MKTRVEKVKAVIEAIEKGTSKKDINPKSNGTYAGKLFKTYLKAKEEGFTGDALYSGGTMGDALINRMHSNLESLPNMKSSSPARIVKPKQITEKTAPLTKVKEAKITELQKNQQDFATQLQKLQKELQKTRQDFTALQEEVTQLKRSGITERITEITESTEKHPENVLGFTLACAKGYWYASKRLEGKNFTVYVGKTRDRAKAETAIRKKFPHLVEKQADLFESE